ncbi:MAG TPA: Fur family transcriptional regulator [Solirubrobacteraceae bacterium]|jgi:Fur family ferric uptake transcriptional regulator|nr:Fur family transcriptional regulator [Solirubrobacteraceae bacterium]
MARSTHAESSWAASASARLAEAGYRHGGARAAVLQQLDDQACALTAYDIEAALRDRGRAVGRASVYRVLEELHELGLVTKVELGQGQARYEPARAEHHHHHLVCDTCGDVVPFDDERLERAIATLSKRVDFDVSEHEIVLHGACANCRG